jgi:putative methyltransferase (TIGR04325 family)
VISRIGEWIPSGVVQFIEANVLGRAVTFRGPFSSWQAAESASSGYDDASILEAAARAARAVVRGDADYDRDGVTFRGCRIEPGVVACLLAAAARSGQHLSVLDFGGGLGSTYRQCLPMLRSVNLTWAIVEQRGFVDRGRAEFETEGLRFFYRIDEAAAQGRPHVVLASGVLGYVESPYETLAELIQVSAPFLVIDRTAVVDRSHDILAVQHVSKSLYGKKAAYPAWCLSRSRLLAHLSGRYRLVAEFGALDSCYRVAGSLVTPSGFFFERTSQEQPGREAELSHAN